MFVVAHRVGGQVIGAFQRERAIGFVLAVPALRNGHTYFHSHMAAVLPEYQNCGIGSRLKLAQREDAVARGVDLIEWTFDPLQLRNAHFNIVRLGVIVREYVPNFYGQTSSPLHFGMPTDRRVAQWWILDPGVEQIPSVRQTNWGPIENCVSVPTNIREMCESDPQSAQKVQRELRSEFQRLFSQSMVVTGFAIDDKRGRYLLQHYEN
jgi:predicted GNAT superfamily acetyltransferase